MVSCTQKYSTSQYVLIQSMIYNVYLSIYFNIQGISGYILACDIAKCLANLWIEGMKAPLRHIKWITSGTHCTPEQLRLPFHTPQGCQGSVHYMCLQDMIELCWSPTGTDSLSALLGNPNSSCRFSPIHSASFQVVGSQHRPAAGSAP